jgi:putative FmdB family regulatory protein
VPTYAYRCTEGHEFERLQRMSDDPLTECEVCGAPVSRLLFAPAIHFKGTGFHNTDYGTRKRGARDAETGGSSGSDANGAGPSSADGGGETKVKEATRADTAARTTGP